MKNRRELRGRRAVRREPKPRREQRGEKVELTVRGMARGQIRMEMQDGTTLLCARDNARGALFGDRVEGERIGLDRVIVRRVLEHAHEQVVGVLRKRPGGALVEPLERHLPSEIAVEEGDVPAKDGDIVSTQIVRWEDEGGLLAHVTGVIGSFERATSALDALIVSSHLRSAFDADVLAEADALRPADLADDPQRTDLRGLLSFTIDGRDAKDFDDAVSLEPLEGGCVRLGVHIADVGHYVREGTALDREALARGTSIYLPGRVLPMLPEQLSNGVCSLRPDEDKFTMTALLTIDESGEIVDTQLLRTITRSNARFVYDDVNAFFDGDGAQREQLAGKHPELPQTLLEMKRLAGVLRARRTAQGSIDFDTEEPQFVLDAQGEPVEILKRERGEAERMIEDFMLAANEAVARFARTHGVPLLYRVHEKPDPDKLAIFKDFLDGLGVSSRRLTAEAKPGDIRAILEQTRERPEYAVISMLALRSMQKARYDEHPLGHYGLAMPDYCHFTSPIRRYPDLVVSRALTAVLTGKRVTLTGERLSDAAIRSSECERAAIEAERAADRIMMARLMAGHVGEVFSGTVSGVSESGFYVALSNGAEGFVPARTLEDWFDFDERHMRLRGERTGAVISLGQAVTVRVSSVELSTGFINLELTGPLKPGKKTEKSEKKQERERMRAFTR
ncbi:MAG: ribonuclease R [Clostridiales bacterium]|nr:ribonuclease R [Clostridiales bacterium]MDY5515443.1 ribonuclease R [Candidatus Ventricola sp.]